MKSSEGESFPSCTKGQVPSINDLPLHDALPPPQCSSDLVTGGSWQLLVIGYGIHVGNSLWDTALKVSSCGGCSPSDMLVRVRCPCQWRGLAHQPCDASTDTSVTNHDQDNG